VGIQRGVIGAFLVITTFNDAFSVVLQILPDDIARESPESPVFPRKFSVLPHPRYHHYLGDF
jgi:hypothetical protein